jgi:hypothetical protein
MTITKAADGTSICATPQPDNDPGGAMQGEGLQSSLANLTNRG